MISTVTTTTVTTVSSIALAASLTLVAVLLLLILLIQKEIVSSIDEAWARRLSRVLNIALAPTLLAFAFIATVKMLEVLY
jgi:hypothetical protein